MQIIDSPESGQREPGMRAYAHAHACFSLSSPLSSFLLKEKKEKKKGEEAARQRGARERGWSR